VSAEEVSGQVSRSNLLGDKDGFGLGLKEGDIRVGFFDEREARDPFFTDVVPVPTEGDFPSINFSYTHSGVVPGSSAELRMLTYGIQDGDSQVTGSNTDIRLFLDGEEIPGAFDDVDQFDRFPEVGWAGIVGLVTIEIPPNLINLFSDGEVEVKFEVNQLGTGSSIDAFAIDYSELIMGTD
jgi:hypothetical protein